MALSLTSTIKDKVARRLGSATYANLNTNLAALVDGEGASALLQLEDEASWFVMTAGTSAAPDSWEPYFVDEIALRVSMNAHPERLQAYTRMRDVSRLRAFDFYARNAPNYNPGSTTEAFIQTVQNIRNYVIAHCVRMKPSLIPAVDTIDAATWEVYTSVWNKAGFPFRRRPVKYHITRTEFTGASWTESTKTLTTTGVSTSLPTGARIYVTAGTSANQGEYPVASTTSTTVVLNQSLSATGGDLTDISFFYYTVNIVGLESGETVDSISSNRLYLAGGNVSDSTPVMWATGDDFAAFRGTGDIEVGAPRRFRVVQIAPTTIWPLFFPAPDDDYSLSGEVLVTMPAAPTTASATTMFTKFDASFGPPLRRAILDRVLTNYNRHNDSLHAQVSDEIERLFPVYADPGEVDNRVGPADVYGDVEDMTNGTMMLGGPL